MSDVQQICHTNGYHIFVHTIKYSMRKCLYCHHRCLFRLRKMFKCKVCSKVMHMRCLVQANYNNNVFNRIEQDMINTAAWRNFYGEGDGDGEGDGEGEGHGEGEGGNPYLMAEQTAMHVTMLNEIYHKTQLQQAGITNGNCCGGQIQLQEEHLRAMNENGDGQIQAEYENVKAVDGNGDGEMQAEVKQVKGTDGNGAVQIQAEYENVKAVDGNGDGEMQAEVKQVKGTDGNGAVQIQAGDGNVKVTDGSSDGETQAEVINFQGTDGNGVVQVAGKGDQFQQIRVLGVIALNLNLVDGIDLQKLLQKLIQSTFKTVHPAYFAMMDYIKLIWITKANPKKGSCAEDFRQGFLSTTITMTDVLSELDYVELSQSNVFEKKNSVELNIVYGLVIINSKYFEN